MCGGFIGHIRCLDDFLDEAFDSLSSEVPKPVFLFKVNRPSSDRHLVVIWLSSDRHQAVIKSSLGRHPAII